MFLVEAAHQKPRFRNSFSTALIQIALTLGLCLALAMHSAGTSFARPALAAMAVDARTGKILYAKDADGYRYPASLTKMMTLYVLFQDLKAGRVKLGTKLRVSRRASLMAPSKLGLRPGNTISVENAIKALVTKSANDVAATIGENLASSEGVFASRMTKVARSIGMRRSVFRNASGLPAPGQVTTARDMATLSLRLQRDFPQYYPYFRITAFNYNGRIVRTHNRLLGRFEGADGIKTGYTAASGYNLTSSARRGDRRVVGVVLGANSSGMRNAFMMRMLEKAFPSCAPGRTIAAQPGTSAGAVDPVKNALTKVALSAGTSTDAQAGQADDEDQTETATVAAPTEPTVVEAKIGNETAPKTQPFKVKSAADTAGGTIVASISPSQWKIQLGAYPTKEDAQATLKKARASGLSSLDGKQAFTIEVQKGAETIFRARFSGFSAQSAKDACRDLSQRGMACMALAPQS